MNEAQALKNVEAQWMSRRGAPAAQAGVQTSAVLAWF